MTGTEERGGVDGSRPAPDGRAGVPPATAGGAPWWLSFTGLIPVALILVPLLAGAWTIAIVVNLAASVGVIAFHLAKRQGVTSFDLLVLALGIVNAILWFGLGQTWLLTNFAVPLYALLALECALSIRRGAPWTAQFARRGVDPSLWETDGFRTVNEAATRHWARGFALCALLALIPPPGGVIASTVVLVLVVRGTRRVVARARAEVAAGTRPVAG
jgi:hypothetical protein